MELRSGEHNGKDYPRLLELGKDDKYRGMIAEFLRNKTGPVPEATLAGLRETGIDKALGITTETNFLRPEYWDRGVTGQNKGLLDRMAQFVTFLYIQSAVEAAFAKEGNLGTKLATGLGAGATDFFGMATQTWQAFPSAELSNLRNAALPDGIAYKDLLPKEQAGLDKALAAAHPEEFKQAQQKAQAGQDPALQAYRTARDANNKAEFGRVDTIVKGVQNGTYNPTAARLAIKEISAETSQKNAELRKTPEYVKATSEFTNQDTALQKALDLYYRIPDSTKDASGKVNWGRAEQIREQLFASLTPNNAQRLRQEVTSPTDADHPYLQLLTREAPLIDRYMSIQDDRERNALRIANPFDDAKLVYLGYQPYVLTSQAATYLKGLAPGQPARVGSR